MPIFIALDEARKSDPLHLFEVLAALAGAVQEHHQRPPLARVVVRRQIEQVVDGDLRVRIIGLFEHVPLRRLHPRPRTVRPGRDRRLKEQRQQQDRVAGDCRRPEPIDPRKRCFVRVHGFSANVESPDGL